MALCELREDDAEALAHDFRNQPNVSVHTMDGYTALRAMLPPPEKRALVLIDPPFESATEFADILGGLREALRRLPSGVYAVWYPITERARSDWFHQDVLALGPPPTLLAELQIAGDAADVRMKGCGLLILNPPWQIEGRNPRRAAGTGRALTARCGRRCSCRLAGAGEMNRLSPPSRRAGVRCGIENGCSVSTSARDGQGRGLE